MCTLNVSDTADTEICVTYTSSEYIISSDGWVPITRDHVYNPTNFIHTPLKPHTITSNTIKVIKAQNDQEKDSKLTKQLDSFLQSGSTPFLGFRASVNVDDKTTVENNENIRNATESLRKAKKILERSDENYLGHASMRKYDSVLEQNVGGKVPTITNRANRYEVEEPEEDTDNHQDADQDTLEQGFGYDYTPPLPQNLNFSSTLINILSKYNIKTDEKLQNYDLSRQRKAKIPFVPEISYSRHRYNSLNHLPVDPLLAVFLSNYGFYIPSLYGIKSNYNNLYGYLASNNIHNNRPFGLYKIFSDTDSWN
ncbi:unnamed protein product [Arctia plantaginis]|uniref:Uncharacterized protein n=1 Tax=Arctia plantaginis TaxID=874455 RepID=A0A8S0Z5H6_ARCPL|nr:unnamed protein product [Arctia plantaginis]CAB3237441.1 unnamed protein product [Arctia plantaginis]